MDANTTRRAFPSWAHIAILDALVMACSQGTEQCAPSLAPQDGRLSVCHPRRLCPPSLRLEQRALRIRFLSSLGSCSCLLDRQLCQLNILGGPSSFSLGLLTGSLNLCQLRR